MDVRFADISNNLIDNIVDALDCDMVCFMNPDTCEVEDIPLDVLLGMYQDITSQEALRRIDRWEKYITIEPLETPDMVKAMQTFINEHIPSGTLKKQLHEALSLRRPDKYFHAIVEDSGYRDKWAAYHRQHMMRHVKSKLRDQLKK